MIGLHHLATFIMNTAMEYTMFIHAIVRRMVQTRLLTCVIHMSYSLNASVYMYFHVYTCDIEFVADLYLI